MCVEIYKKKQYFIYQKNTSKEQSSTFSTPKETKSSEKNQFLNFLWYDTDSIEKGKKVGWARKYQTDLISFLTKIMGDTQRARWYHKPPNKK
jgi:hypothetical protein